MAGIDDHTNALGLAYRRGHTLDSRGYQILEACDRCAWRAAFVCELFELAAMIERQHIELTPRPATHRRRVMYVFEAIVEVGPRHSRRARYEFIELDATRHRRRAAVSAHDE